MTLLNRIKDLCEENSITLAKLEKSLEFGNGTLSRWDTSSPSVDKIQKVADYFGVSIDYLMGNEKFEQKELPALTKKDERDVEKRLNETLEELELSQGGLIFDGEPLDDITKELLIQSIRHGIELSKKIAKQKYTPKKYRK